MIMFQYGKANSHQALYFSSLQCKEKDLRPAKIEMIELDRARNEEGGDGDGKL